MALNTPLYACGPELQAAASKRVEYRRGKAVVAVGLDYSALKDKTVVAMRVGGKLAFREVDSHESAWRAVDEMIDELWPLELV